MLRKIKQQLAIYRLAVLKTAFEGKYTKEWRINHADEDVKRDYYKIKIRNPVFKDTAGDENEIALSIPETWLKIRIGEIFDVEIELHHAEAYPNIGAETLNGLAVEKFIFSN